MKSFKRQGWKYESARHSLAAKGVSTGNYFSKKKLSASIMGPVIQAGENLPGASRRAGEHSGTAEAIAAGKSLPAASRLAGEEHSGTEEAVMAGEATPAASRAAGEEMESFMAKKHGRYCACKYCADKGMYRVAATLEHHTGDEDDVAVLVPKTDGDRQKAEKFLRKLAEESNSDLEIKHVQEVNVAAHKKPKIMFNKGEFYTSDLDVDVEKDRMELQ